MKVENALKDQYRKLAKQEGYRSRSTYKLLELNKKYDIIKNDDTIIDIGCAPGGWLQVSKKYSGPNGKVLGLDINPVEPLIGITIIQADIEDANIVQTIKNSIRIPIDVVLSDLAPKISGIWHFDHERQVSLTLVALNISTQILKRGGNAVFKIFEGDNSNIVKQEASKVFLKVITSKPKASRQKSSEFYLICSGFSANVQ